MIDVAALRVMVAAGVPASTIVDVIEADQQAQLAKITERRTKDAERQRRHRVTRSHAESRGVTVTECDPPSPVSPSDGSPTPPPITTPSSLSPVSKAKRLSRRAEPLPSDWKPDREFARSKGFSDSQIDEQAARFRDHAAANRRLQADWDASWRNWIRSPLQRTTGPPMNGYAPRPGSKEDTRERTVNALRCLDPFPSSDGDSRGEEPGTSLFGVIPFAKPARS